MKQSGDIWCLKLTSNSTENVGLLNTLPTPGRKQSRTISVRLTRALKLLIFLQRSSCKNPTLTGVAKMLDESRIVTAKVKKSKTFMIKRAGTID